MNKKQIDSIKSLLHNKVCPICKDWISPLSNPILANNVTTAEEQLYLENIDLSDEDYIDIECEHCGYIMTFRKHTLFR